VRKVLRIIAGEKLLGTGLASLCESFLCRLVGALAGYRVSMMLLVSAPRPSHFFFEMRKEEVTKKKAHPTSGPGCAGVPSLHRRSMGPP